MLERAPIDSDIFLAVKARFKSVKVVYPFTTAVGNGVVAQSDKESKLLCHELNADSLEKYCISEGFFDINACKMSTTVDLEEFQSLLDEDDEEDTDYSEYN